VTVEIDGEMERWMDGWMDGVSVVVYRLHISTYSSYHIIHYTFILIQPSHSSHSLQAAAMLWYDMELQESTIGSVGTSFVAK
jgi:hypothetical protein